MRRNEGDLRRTDAPSAVNGVSSRDGQWRDDLAPEEKPYHNDPAGWLGQGVNAARRVGRA